MPSWTLRRIAAPDVLRDVDPGRLIRLLDPFRDYLTDQGVALPVRPAGPVDYDGLIRVFLSPGPTSPEALVDALYLIDEMATPDGMDALAAGAARRGLDLVGGRDLSPADVAVEAWLCAPDLLEHQHAETQFVRVRSFESYQTVARPPAFARPGAAVLAAWEADLDDTFAARNRGRGARVIVGDRDEAVWFVIRHPEPIKREDSLDGGVPRSVCFRPLRHDVLVYDPPIGELRINARSRWEKDLYRETFGRHLFGDPGLFPGAERYTLEPLRADGPAALVATDVPGIEGVTLREVQLYHGGSPWELVTRKSDDLFRLLAAHDRPFPASGRLVRATFGVAFAGSRSPRTVVVKPSNVAQYTRDADSGLVDRWLAARGFLITSEAPDDGPADPVLDGD